MIQNNDQRITYFGLTDSRNQRTPFGIKQEDRSRHSYVIGKTGMGKSTMLENMAVQDIQNGEGICFIDPHGGTAEKLLEYIPEERIRDVLYFAPFDMQYPVSFNVLENVDADKRHLVVAGLMSTFEKIWVDAWSARMAYILQNTLASLLEFPGATLLGVNRMYIDKEYRKNVIAKITDPAVRSFWVDEYSKYTDRYAQEATPAIQNKIGQFASNALVRNVIGQEQSAFNIRNLMDERKIFIVNLSKGRVGEGNANLLGSMLITKIYLAAMSRADVSSGDLRRMPPFYLFVDEFQNFANKSFAGILSEARKYKLSLTIAHQYIEQMEEEVRAAVFGNVGTMVTFRVGAFDAEVLEKEFSPVFTADDLVNLGSRQIYLKLMIDGVTSQPFSAVTMPPIPEPEVNHRDRAIAFSRAQFSRPRAEVENDIGAWVVKKYDDPDATAKEAARDERRMARDVGGERAQAQSFAPHQAERPPYQQRAPRPTDTRSNMPRPSVGVARNPVPTRQPVPPAPRPSVDRNGPSSQPLREYPNTNEQRNAPVRPPAPIRTAPPPPPPVRKEQGKEDLRALLATLAQQQSTLAPAPVTVPQERPADTGSSSQRSVPPHGAQPFTQRSSDDGKSVTEEGKQQLRELLASVTNNHSVAGSPPAQHAPTPPPQMPRSESTAREQCEHVEVPESNGTHAPVRNGEAPRQSTQGRQQRPVEQRGRPEHHNRRPHNVSVEKVQTMLAIDKPDLA